MATPTYEEVMANKSFSAANKKFLIKALGLKKKKRPEAAVERVAGAGTKKPPRPRPPAKKKPTGTGAATDVGKRWAKTKRGFGDLTRAKPYRGS